MTFSVIDSLETPQLSDGISYTWTGYIQEENKFSLLKIIEDNGEYYKKKYLNWICELGKHEYRGKSLVDHFSFKDEFSYWWMMPITEKSIWKSTYITDIIRLMALEELIVQHQPSTLKLYSNDRTLNEVLSKFCRSKNIKYQWYKVHRQREGGLTYFISRIPLPVKALFSIAKYLVQRWPFSKHKSVDWFSDDKSIFFCSYFFNLDNLSLKSGEYRSRYWGDLNKLISGLGIKSNWLQLYYKHEVIPNPEIALKTAGIFNENKEESHRFLDSQLSLNLVLDVIKSLIRLIKTSFYLKHIKNAFKSGESGMSFWPLIRKEWNNSLYGPIAVSNLFYYHLFNKVISKLPHQKKGLYIYEDQAWERAFIHAWREYGHGKLIAVAHATVRFWDMRYSSDSRLTDQSHSKNFMPFPDFVALNGQAAIDNYLNTEYPVRSIKECEALRFLNINQKEKSAKSQRPEKDKLKVLILGDYLPEGTENMMELLQNTMNLLPENITFTLKPHPRNLVNLEDYPLLKIDIISEALEDILYDYDIAYASNFTSASVDAYITGMRVVVILDEYQLNVSPLRSRENVIFVNTPEQLAKAFTHDEAVKQIDGGKNFFFLDPKLPRWREIIMDTQRSN